MQIRVRLRATSFHKVDSSAYYALQKVNPNEIEIRKYP